MNTSIRKRLLSFLLAAIIVLGFVPVNGTPKAEAAVSTDLATAISNLRTKLETLPVPYAEKITDPAQLTGRALILADTPESTAYKVAMDIDRPNTFYPVGNTGFEVENIPVTGNYAYDYNLRYATTIGTLDGHYTLQASNGLYWHYPDVGLPNPCFMGLSFLIVMLGHPLLIRKL